MTPVNEPPRKTSRLGFLAGQIQVPDNFDQMASEPIEQLFGTAYQAEPLANPPPLLTTDD